MGGVCVCRRGKLEPSTFSVSDIDAVIDEFRDAPGVVIDARPNGGGDDALAVAFAGRFATRNTTIGYARFRNGPRHDDFGNEVARQVGPGGSSQFTRPVIVPRTPSLPGTRRP